MKKRILALVLALCMVFALAACSNGNNNDNANKGTNNQQNTNTANVINIGAIGCLTGAASTYGVSVANGIKLAVDEINNAGGIDVAGTKYTIALTQKDDQGDPTECLNAFNELTGNGIELIIGSVISSCSSAITSPANTAGVVMITPTSTADAVTTTSDYVFRSCYADSNQGAIAAAYAAQQGYTKVGVVYCAADTYSKGLYDSFSAACAANNVEIVVAESTDTMEANDFSNQFQSVIDSGVDFVFAPYYYGTVGPYLVPSARRAGYTGIIMGADGYDGVLGCISEGTEEYFYDVIFTNHYDSADTSDVVKNFVTAYGAAYNNEVPTAFAALAYDATYMMVQAITKAGAFDAASVKAALDDQTVVYTGVTGTFSLDATGTPNKGAAIIEFTNDGTSVTTQLRDTVSIG
ncbi:MAG: ABC transporter substrate-binding protein [Clostridiales bacterium]|nr:ABC transporter substrate-binding protein [Clostridiales bacterium]